MLVLLSVSKTCAQNYRGIYDSLSSKTPAVKLEYVLDSVLSAYNDVHSTLEAAKMAHVFSVRFYVEKRDFNMAIKYGLIEIDNYDKLDIVNKNYIIGLYQLGIFYKRSNDLKNAKHYYQQVIDLNIDEVKVAQSYGELGYCYRKSGDFYKSVDYYKKAISILEDLKESSKLVRRYLDLAIVYQRINTVNSLSLRLLVLKKAEKLSEEIRISAEDYDRLNHGFGNYYYAIDSFSQAKKYYNKLLIRNDSSRVSAAYTNLGNLYIKENSDSALWYFKKSLTFPMSEQNIALAYHNICDFYLKKNQWNMALEYIHKSLVISTRVDQAYADIPTNESLASASSKYNVLDFLTKKALVLLELYKEENNLNYVNIALANLETADILIGILHNESFEEQSRFHWRKEASEVYLQAILCCEILGKDKLAFAFAERNKALLLTESIIENVGKLNFPKEVLKKENTLKKKIFHIKNLLSKNKVLAERKKLEDQLFTTKLLHQNFLDSLQSIFPEYYSRESKTALFSLHSVQSQLDSNAVIVYYIWNKGRDQFDALFGISVSREDVHTFKITDSKEVEKLVDTYKTTISKPFETVQEQQQFNRVSHQLFNKLFPTERIKAQLKGKHVIIVSDNDLQNVSFEALVSNENTNEYLIESSEISYAYSMSFLLHNKAIPRNATKNFIGFSPTTFQYNSLEPLSYTDSEVKTIEDIVGGKKVLNRDASKTSFIKESNDYKIIHLATHASASQNPWIAFNDSTLEAHELYTFKNQAELVVLSACNTAIGEISEGEGVMSLARGFFYAGANTVVSTLWNANDKSTAYIMEQFYKNLKNGENKSTSLHKAKLAYIKSHSLSDGSPYYWASFVLIGDYKGISIKDHNNFLIIGVILSFLLLCYFLYLRLKK